MNQLTVRQVPAELTRELKQTAHKMGLSLNKVIVELLKRALGLHDENRSKRDLSGVAGTWDKKQARDFLQHTKAFEKIDDEIWQ